MLKTYEDFVNEKKMLLPSQFREYMGRFNRKRYATIFKKYKTKYSGDRNAYRIYLPLLIQERENLLEKEITEFLKKNDYEVVDYFKGTCKRGVAKNTARIGAVLQKLGDEKLMKKFIEDPERKKGKTEDLEVVISRHPYDIAGSDTDRDWTNCMTMKLPKSHPRIKRMMDAGKKTTDYEIEGENTGMLEQEVRYGTIVAYLIEKNDRNIERPLSVLNIKAYRRGKMIYLNACSVMYGRLNEDFRYTVTEWLKEINQGKTGAFNLNPNV